MPELFIYLIKVNIALLVFCLGYYLVLRRLTFYTLNRIYLVTAIVFSTLYPRMDLMAIFNRHEPISKPVQVLVVNWQGQMSDLAQTATQHDKWFWLQGIFWLGVILLAIRLLLQLISLYKLHRRSEPAQVQQYIVRTINGNINPFSFWRNIYLNPENHTPAELRAILEHEQIHVSEWHTLDILLGEVSTVFYWFNPGIWLMKRAIRENIEFITDRKILQKGMDSKAYQYSLLNVNFGAQQNTIVNHFNISTIKKRIIMMNTKRSSRLNITRYVVLVPIVVLFLSMFSVTKAQLAKAAKNSARAISSSIQTAVAKIDLIGSPPAAPVQELRKAEMLGNASFSTLAADTSNKKSTFEATIIDLSADANDIKRDTNKRMSVRFRPLSYDKNTHIYVDGKEVANGGLDSISPNTINQINVFRVKTDKDGDLGNGYIFITTKGSDANFKKTQEIIAQLRKENKIDVDTTAMPKRIAFDKVYVTGTSSASGSGDNKLTAVTVTGHPRIANVRITARDGKTADSTVIINSNGYSTFSTRGAVSIRRKDTTQNNEEVVVGYGAKPAARTITNVRINSDNTPANFDNILKVIDGKEVSDDQFRKLMADGKNISTITVLKDESATKLYGDKGKNGVLIITTKGKK